MDLDLDKVKTQVTTKLFTAKTLAEAGILTQAELAEVEARLAEIAQGEDGYLESDEDVHSAIERLLGDVGRYLIAAAIVVGLGLAIGYRPAGGALGMLGAVGVVLVFALGLSWVWTALGLVLRTPSAVQTLGLLVLFPLTFMSNVFVQPSTMPDWLRVLVDANPVSHVVTAARGLSDGTASVGEVGWALAAAGILTALFAPLSLRLYERER